MSTSAVYPVGIAPALGHLHSGRNEIEIFVEDTSAKNVWRALLKNFLPDDVRFSDPIQLGGREKTLLECRRDQTDDGRRKLYIIDADLDLLQGKPKPKLKHLYRLRSYCIENYLLNQNALTDVATILDPDVSVDDARTRLDFKGWLEENRFLLTGLFQCYALTNELAEHHQTVGFHGSRLAKASPSQDRLCPHKTRKRVYKLYRLVRAEVGLDTIRSLRVKIENNLCQLGTLQFASGKDYLFPLMKARLKRCFGSQMNDSTLKVLLARSTSKDVDRYLSRRLALICDGLNS